MLRQQPGPWRAVVSQCTPAGLEKRPGFLSTAVLKTFAVGAIVGASLLAAPQPSHAQSDFYAGKTITIVVGASAGGGYDIYARAIAPFLSEKIPGKPKIIIQNMPGGGGWTSVLYLDASAPKDGTVITLFNAGVLTDAITNPKEARVDFTKMAWLGSANRSFRICYFWHGKGFGSWKDLDGSKQATLGAIGVNSASFNDIMILKNLMKKNVRPILGYPGRSEVHLAIERGELDGECGSLEGLPENWIKDKKIDVVVSLSSAKTSEIPDGTPWMGDFLKDPEDLDVLRLLTAANELGRPFVMSRQVPAERVAILRKAFEEVMVDKKFLALAEQRKMGISAVTGQEAQDMLAKVFSEPESVSDKAKQVLK